MKVVVLQSNYIPWKGYFDLINDADIFCFYDEVKYTKNDWRNRNVLLNKNGPFWITIPIAKDAVKLKISEVTIENSTWQQQHFKTLEQTYARAPYKKEILELLSPYYLQTTYTNLSALNQDMIKCISRYIGLDVVFRSSSEFELAGDRVGRLIDLILQLGGTEYISGPSAKDYLAGSEQMFEAKGIVLKYKQYGPYRTYQQILPGFENAVSIIDVLMYVPKGSLLDFIKSQV